jgi:hypothetical protein
MFRYGGYRSGILERKREAQEGMQPRSRGRGEEPPDPIKGSVPDRKWVIAWIQSFLEPVYRKWGVRDLARFTLGKRVSWSPAEKGKT